MLDRSTSAARIASRRSTKWTSIDPTDGVNSIELSDGRTARREGVSSSLERKEKVVGMARTKARVHATRASVRRTDGFRRTKGREGVDGIPSRGEMLSSVSIVFRNS